MKKKSFPVALSILAVAAFAVGAQAAEGQKGWMQESEREETLDLTPNLENGREVYEVCSACHMPNGWGMTDGTFPQLAGQHRSVIIKQLADIRAQNRDNPTMYPFALPSEIGGPQAIADVAEYIARLPVTPYNGTGPGERLDLGEKLYKDNCVRCHGEHGEGIAEKFYPRIGGQHYEYLLRQFTWIKEGKRRNANPDMIKQIQEIPEADMNTILDYTSRLQPPAEFFHKDCADALKQPLPRAEPDKLCWDNPDFL